MPDQFNVRMDDGDQKSFAELIDEYPEGMHEDIGVGDRVEGRIIAIGMDTVFVNTGSKIDGAVDRAELTDEEGNMPCAVGDTLTLYVTSVDENEMRLSRALSGEGGLNLLREAREAGAPVEGKVIASVKGGFQVEVFKRRAFCPISQMDVRYVEKPEDYIGLTLSFLISRIEEKGRNIVLSRRELLERERAVERDAFLKTLSEGDVITGEVTRLMPYGAFVAIAPGLEGMVHVSEISWSRLDSPADALSSGDRVTVKVLGLEPGEKSENTKISLSIKATGQDPWDTVTQQFALGDRVRGKVTRCVDFGAFVEIAPGIEGLVHISEMSYKRRVAKAEDVVRPGDVVDLVVKDVDPDKKRIGLSLRDAEGDPWAEAPDRFAVGQAVSGTVEKREAFGIFVTLAPGITGLLPKSKIRNAARPGEIDKLKAGDFIPVVVEQIQVAERRITLGPADTADEGDWRKYAAEGPADSGAPSTGGLGSLGEKLRQAMDSKRKKEPDR